MLKKLLKYELKATARLFLPIFAILAILTPFAKLMTHFENVSGPLKIISTLVLTGYIFAMIATSLCSIVIIIIHFFKSMVSLEGYLTHTLPVSIHQLLVSKLIIAVFWSILSFLGMFLSIFTLLYSKDFVKELRFLWDNFILLLQSQDANYLALFIYFAILLFIAIIYYILGAFCSISLGQVISKNKVGGAIAGGIILYIAAQVVSSIVSMPFLLSINSIDETNITAGMNTLLPMAIIINVVFCVAFYWITAYILNKKLNLE